MRYAMQVLNQKVLTRFVRQHSDAADWLENWMLIASTANWRRIQDVKAAFPAVDGGVKVKSGGSVSVFDVCGNRYRMVVTMIYNTQVITILEVMTHSDYSKDHWKQRY
jgi:mRNA interferase HigB